MKLGSFYRSTVETVIEVLVSPARPFKGPGWRNQAGEGIGIMGEVYFITSFSIMQHPNFTMFQSHSDSYLDSATPSFLIRL